MEVVKIAEWYGWWEVADKVADLHKKILRKAQRPQNNDALLGKYEWWKFKYDISRHTKKYDCRKFYEWNQGGKYLNIWKLHDLLWYYDKKLQIIEIWEYAT